MPRVTLVLAMTCLVGGCGFGPTAKTFRPAQGPQGVNMTVMLVSEPGRLSGELLEVRDTGLLILSGDRLWLLPYRAITSSRVDQTSSRFAVRDQRAPDPEAAERLRLLSRFPYGLEPESLQELLRAHGQTEPAGTFP